ncbi:hypothetical protein [Endozoicomonas arenosclerae]|uniref:hypothetical protein n=1 Tax=Endozoicomonas arenosclerae TaxID=1633495 RepID=UPI0007815038|nr:hypothetical protein [Endozoicomonas arenosclerae]
MFPKSVFCAALICFLFAVLPVRADLESLITYIDSMLVQGEKVLIMTVDMSYGNLYSASALPRFAFNEKEESIRASVGLLEEFSDDDDVLFLNVQLKPSSDDQPKMLLAVLEEMAKKQFKTFYYRNLVQTTEPENPEDFVIIHSADEYLAWIEGDLTNLLKLHKLKNVAIVGYDSEDAVKQLADSAAMEGRRVIVDPDLNVLTPRLMSQTNESVHKKNLDSWDELIKKYPNNIVRIKEGEEPICRL